MAKAFVDQFSFLETYFPVMITQELVSENNILTLYASFFGNIEYIANEKTQLFFLKNNLSNISALNESSTNSYIL